MNSISLIVKMVHEAKKLGCTNDDIRCMFKTLVAYGPLRKNNLKHFATA